MFNVGDAVVKAGLGIAKIKAVQTLSVEGKEKNLYVLQSGEVKVMIPCEKAHTGVLRAVLTKEQIAEIENELRSSYPLPEQYEKEDPDGYSVDHETAFDKLKHRDPKSITDMIHRLFYKSKLVKLTPVEDKIYNEAMKSLSEEIAHVEHTTRQTINDRLKDVLLEGRKARKDAHFQPQS
jgi:RNA polymerase-interacting CarD/CdnL/TRCF family regulator